jgi:threonine aldolase
MFYSDNVTGACQPVLDAIVCANQFEDMPYGNDKISQALNACFSSLFQTDVFVFPVGTGTVANCLALSALCPSYGSVLTHEHSHIYTTESSGPEFFCGGARMTPVSSENTKIGPSNLEQLLSRTMPARVHEVQPSVLNITQPTDFGTVYSLDELSQLSSVAREYGLKIQMDGARFANAVAHLGCEPADITWKAGVDSLVFGMTKNGTLDAEALIFFDPDLARKAAFLHKRAGQLFSKMRFQSAQLRAMLTNNLWLENARHANRMARKLAASLSTMQDCSIVHSVDANEVFVRWPNKIAGALKTRGFQNKTTEEGGYSVTRFVTSFATTEKQLSELFEIIRVNLP